MTNSEIILSAVKDIKDLLEDYIRNPRPTKKGEPQNGAESKNNLIRSQIPINKLHDAAKRSFIELGVDPDQITPKLGEKKPELTIYGRLKKKSQDVCLLPNNINKTKEILGFDGVLQNKKDPLGFDYSQRVLAVNVRSQLSSTEKNFDTLYERTFAEPLNFHLRCPSMVLGEFYMIPVFEYDDEQAKNSIVAFKTKHNDIEKYILGFDALNNRNTTTGDFYKYERVCLLIVDFKPEQPKVYTSLQELKDDHIVSDGFSHDISNLTFDNFTAKLLNAYEQRFDIESFKRPVDLFNAID